MALWPALDVRLVSDADLVLADASDFSPTAAEDRGDTVRIFFRTFDARKAACTAFRSQHYVVAPVDVDDEDWARRSQLNSKPITVGRITVLSGPADSNDSPDADAGSIRIVIQPSMGFGTGHHATTRLCLHALQSVHVQGASVLDVGTGSGILAIAASRLGASHAVGIDDDADAIRAACENLTFNAAARDVQFAVTDVTASPLPRAEIVVANLTGALIARAAATLSAAVSEGGTLILGGILAAEEDAVRRAFRGADVTNRHEEDEWVCLTFNRRLS
jgi:ribosomal protein L11 methyltransferase